MKRRQMLIGCSAGLLAAGGARELFAGQPAPEEPAVSPALSKATFEPLVDTRFRLFDGRRSEGFVLRAVEDVPSSRDLEQFDLVFRGSGRTALRAGKYDLWHPQIGRLSLYLEPSRAARGRSARATFSLLR
jgi:hypothetical protein